MLSTTWCLHFLPDNAEEVDVSIVHGEVDKQDSRATPYPAFVKQVVDDLLRLRFVARQVLNIACAAVRRYLTPVARAVQLVLRLVVPTAPSNNTDYFYTFDDYLAKLYKTDIKYIHIFSLIYILYTQSLNTFGQLKTSYFLQSYTTQIHIKIQSKYPTRMTFSEISWRLLTQKYIRSVGIFLSKRVLVFQRFGVGFEALADHTLEVLVNVAGVAVNLSIRR